MYIRDSKNKLIKFNHTNFKTERDMYSTLWKTMYNLKLIKHCKTNDALIKYIKDK